MRAKFLFLLIIACAPVRSQSTSDVKIVVLNFKALKNDIYTVGNRIYRPVNKEDGWVEVKLELTNNTANKVDFDLSNVLLEGGGMARQPTLFLNAMNLAARGIVQLHPMDVKDRKVVYNFPGNVKATSLVISNDYKISLTESAANERIYFDGDGKRVDSESAAVYYRETTKTELGWQSKDFSLATGSLMRESELSSLYPEIKEGLTVLYHENGKIREKGVYAKNKKSGLFFKYFPNGINESKTEHIDKEIRYLQVWNNDGDSLLVNGSGTSEKLNSTGIREITIYSESKLKATMTIREAQQDTLYVVMDRFPEYVGGMKAFANYVEQTMTYPKEAKKNRIQGRVGVNFIVDKEGNLDEIETFDHIGYGCDEEAARIVKSSGKWAPGLQNGTPVKASVLVFINFVL